MCSTAGVTAREQVAVVAAAISRFDTVAEAAGVDDVELVELLAAWQRVEQMAAARKLAVLAEIRERDANRLAGAATAEDLLAQRCGLTKGEAKTQAQAAAAMALPAVAEKLRNGEMTVAQAHVVGSRAAAIAETAETMDAAVAVLQDLDDHVATVDTTATDRNRLGRDLDAWAHRTGHDVLADRERRAHDRRYVQFQARDGGWAVNGLLPAVGGAAVKAALDAIARTHPADDVRDWGQRQADALVTLAERYLDEGALPQVAVQRPHVLLVTTPDALHDSPGAEPSHLDGHGPVSNDTARQVCCEGSGCRHRRSAQRPFSTRAGGGTPHPAKPATPRHTTANARAATATSRPRAALALERVLKGLTAERRGEGPPAPPPHPSQRMANHPRRQWSIQNWPTRPCR